MFIDWFSGTLVFRGIRYYIRKIREYGRTKFFKHLYPSDFKTLKTLRNSYENQPCVIIGGGPSLNSIDFDQLKHYITIACNGFFLKMEELDWKPTFYTIEDPLPAKDNRTEIENLKNVTKIIPADLKRIIKRDKYTTYCNFRRSYLRPKRKDFPRFSFSFEKESFWGGTVVYFNLQLAAHLGCNPIYLVGVDLNYKIPPSVIRNGAVLTSTEDDMNHFDPRYFGKGKKWHIPESERMNECIIKGYHQMKEKGIDILNASHPSKLKEVPRVIKFNKD